MRPAGIGSSDAPEVLGLGYKGRYRLWAEKTGLVPEEDLSDNENVQLGLLFQDAIGKGYALRTGKQVVPADMVYHASGNDWQFASPDFLVVDSDKPVGLLEVKLHSLQEAGRHPPDEPFLRDVVQVQHQLAVCGFEMGAIAYVLDGRGRRLVHWDVPADPVFQDAMTEAEANFWHLVTTNTPPDVDGKESTTKALNRLYSQSGNTLVRIDDDAAV